MRQIPLELGAETARTFEQFLPGLNAAALDQLQALQPQSAPVYLWGASGSGKTHLLKAITHQYQQKGAQTGWFSAGDSMPWQFNERWSLITLDACDTLNPEAQHAAFTLFVEATTQGIALVAAGQLPPVDLPLRDDLRSRLGWGHIFALQPLDEPQTRAALRREADRRGVFLSDEVMTYLLTRYARDLKSLMNMLQQLDHFSLVNQRAITVPLLRQMLADEGPNS
jgi:DnaA-homolog protein